MEIIERQIKPKKKTFDPIKDKIQFSINNFGHLTIRAFNPEKENEDVLIVLNVAQTKELCRFIKNANLI